MFILISHKGGYVLLRLHLIVPILIGMSHKARYEITIHY